MRGSIRRRSENSWSIRYDGPPGPNGKRTQKEEAVHSTKRDAERLLRLRQTEVEAGAYVERRQETVAQFLERWLTDYVDPNVRPITAYGYKGYVRRYIAPAFGNVRIDRLTPRQVQQLYAEMTGRGLSPATVRQTHRIIHEALRHAVKWGVVSRNVAEATDLPRSERGEPGTWDLEHLKRFLIEAASSPYRNIFHLAMLTGLRRSELSGLKWPAVNFGTKSLSIVNVIVRIPGQGLHEGPPKSRKSRRLVVLTEEAVELLHGVRGEQTARKADVGVLWHEGSYVFTRPDGRPVIPDEISKGFKEIVRRTGLPDQTFHGLRHAHATLLLEAGVNLKVVSERLGHSNIGITADIYSHVLPTIQERAAKAFEELWNTPVLPTDLPTKPVTSADN